MVVLDITVSDRNLFLITNHPPLLRILRPRHTVHPVHNHQSPITNHL